MRVRIVAAGVIALFVGALLGPGMAAAGSARNLQEAPTQMSVRSFERVKAELDANSALSKTVTLDARSVTFTYTLSTGSALVLSQPRGWSTGGHSVGPKLGLGGCGWFQLCVYLNRTDQGAIAAGAAAGIGVLICAASGFDPAVCAVTAAALAAAAFYIGTYGICGNELQVELLPVPGTNVRCV